MTPVGTGTTAALGVAMGVMGAAMNTVPTAVSSPKLTFVRVNLNAHDRAVIVATAQVSFDSTPQAERLAIVRPDEPERCDAARFCGRILVELNVRRVSAQPRHSIYSSAFE